MSNRLGHHSHANHLLAVLAVIGACANSVWAAETLQGLDKGGTNGWSSVNLQGWQELDYVPLRISFGTASVGTQTVNIAFPHFSGTVPGFEDLSGFNAFTPNLQFVSHPLLTTDPSGTWSYSFTVSIADQNPAELRFSARIAAGAHLNGGSSLQLKGSAGTLQIHKPAPGLGAPDLAIVASGPATALPGSTITYTLSYTNQSLTNGAIGAQVSDILPPQVTVLTNGLPANASAVGNTVFWDLGNVDARTGGNLVLQAVVDPTAAPATVLTSLAQILSSEDDSNPADNSSAVLTTVLCGGVAPAIFTSPTSVASCPGSSVTFSVTAGDTAGFEYQWRKDGVILVGATNATYTIASVTAADCGFYDVAVSTSCGTVISGGSKLALNQWLPASITQRLQLADGSFQLQFTTGCGGNYFVQYSDDLLTWKTSTQSVIGNGGSAQWVDSGPPVTDSLPTTQSARFYRVVEMP